MAESAAGGTEGISLALARRENLPVAQFHVRDMERLPSAYVAVCSSHKGSVVASHSSLHSNYRICCYRMVLQILENISAITNSYNVRIIV